MFLPFATAIPTAGLIPKETPMSTKMFTAVLFKLETHQIFIRGWLSELWNSHPVVYTAAVKKDEVNFQVTNG